MSGDALLQPTRAGAAPGAVPPRRLLLVASCPSAPPQHTCAPLFWPPFCLAVKLNTCSSYIISWLGFLPMQVVMTATAIANAYMTMPKRPHQTGILQVGPLRPG